MKMIQIKTSEWGFSGTSTPASLIPFGKKKEKLIELDQLNRANKTKRNNNSNKPNQHKTTAKRMGEKETETEREREREKKPLHLI